MPEFTYASARSGSLLGGFALAISVETIVLHLLLVTHHPIVAWLLTATSVSTLLWLVADYRALGRGALRLDDDRLELAIGRRASVVVPLSEVVDVKRPVWQDLPTSGGPASATYLNPLKPASANVLLSLRVPVEVRVLGGVRRPVRQFGLCLDAPDMFVDAMHAALRRTFAEPREQRDQ